MKGREKKNDCKVKRRDKNGWVILKWMRRANKRYKGVELTRDRKGKRGGIEE